MTNQAQHAEDQSEIMDRYVEQGESRAAKLGNRGPIAFDRSGKLSKHLRRVSISIVSSNLSNVTGW